MEGDGNDFPPEEESPNVISAVAVGRLWDQFREGIQVICPRDSGPLALAVDGAAKAYRLVCTSCGMASPWLASSVAGITVRGPTPTLIPPDVDAAADND